MPPLSERAPNRVLRRLPGVRDALARLLDEAEVRGALSREAWDAMYDRLAHLTPAERRRLGAAIERAHAPRTPEHPPG